MTKIEMVEQLSRSPVFKGIPAAELKEMLNRVQHRFIAYKKGKTIASRGDKCEKLMVLINGSVRGEMIDFNGKAIEVETINAPRPIAPGFIFGKNNFFPVDVVADQDITILSIPKPSLIQLIQLNKVVLKNYLDIISNRAYFLSERLWFMSFKTIKEKFAHYIFTLLKPGENKIALPKSQQQLSEFFGVSRPSLARVISEMEEAQVIEHHRREIIIKDPDKLKEMLD
jgi:CRP-like cAMP-binding protein